MLMSFNKEKPSIKKKKEDRREPICLMFDIRKTNLWPLDKRVTILIHRKFAWPEVSGFSLGGLGDGIRFTSRHDRGAAWSSCQGHMRLDWTTWATIKTANLWATCVWLHVCQTRDLAEKPKGTFGVFATKTPRTAARLLTITMIYHLAFLRD